MAVNASHLAAGEEVLNRGWRGRRLRPKG